MRVKLLVALLAVVVMVGCQRGESSVAPSPTTPVASVPLPPVSGPQWQKVATGNGVEVYFEIYYACNCPNYARTLLFWDVVNQHEINRVEFTQNDGWWTNYNRPSQDFHMTPDGTRLAVRMYKSGRFFDTVHLYNMRQAREILRITRNHQGQPFLIDDQNGATTGIVLSNINVTLTMMIPIIWSESGDPDNPDVNGNFSPISIDQTFQIPPAN
jgi:hypothetical protein